MASDACTAIRNTIAQAQDIKKEIVHSTLWNVDIEVRAMSGVERAAVFAEGYDEDGELDLLKYYPAVITACAYVPGTDEKIFTLGDRDMLNGKAAAATEEIAKRALLLSAFTPESVKEAEKNFAASPSS